jgi:hypothetical protein
VRRPTARYFLMAAMGLLVASAFAVPGCLLMLKNMDAQERRYATYDSEFTVGNGTPISESSMILWSFGIAIVLAIASMGLVMKAAANRKRNARA